MRRLCEHLDLTKPLAIRIYATGSCIVEGRAIADERAEFVVNLEAAEKYLRTSAPLSFSPADYAKVLGADRLDVTVITPGVRHSSWPLR